MTSLPTPDEDMERRQIVATVSTVKAKDIIDPSTFSSWSKLIRAKARLHRLAEKIRLSRHAQEGKEGPLNLEELQGADTFWIKQVQKTLHSLLEKGEFKSLRPFIDDKGIVRVGNRIDESIVSCDVLLPHKHRISLLITSNMLMYGHTGVATTTAKTRRK